jgi:tRNA-dihydrouridine synthase 3
MSFAETLQGAVVMAPMTKGSNLPYRRLCVELGARVLVSEMVVARRLKQRRGSEFALIRRAPEEPCFGVQLAGNKPEETAWAAALVESRGADFVDLNLGCPIDHFTRMGLGAALARQPGRVATIVAAVKAAVSVPVTVKIRLGWNTSKRNYLELARAAVDAGAGAVTVHGRTREARYRHPADWAPIAEVAAALPVPVVGNGDLLFAHEIADRLSSTGCAGVMVARGALIKPWIFREAAQGHWDITAGERVAIFRRYVELGLTHWGGDDHGRKRLREFVRWHAGFWCRYAPQRPDGTWPSMQARESAFAARSPLEALLARSDDPALDYVTDELMNGGDLSHPPPAAAPAPEQDLVEAG